MKQLGAIDASFLYMETAQTPLHAGSLCILEPLAGGGSFHDAFRAHVARRLHLAPILGRTLAPGPLDMDHPAWVAGRVDLDHHVRRISLPRPGSRRQLDDLVARLHSNPLDGDRPLWEFHVIEGLEGGRAALYAKLHHAVLDADAGVQLTEALFDASAEPREVEPPPEAPPPAPAAEAPETPSFLSFLGNAQSNLLRQQMRALSMIPEAWQTWTRAMMPGGGSPAPSSQAAQDGSRATQERPAPPRTPLNGTVTSQRSYAARSLPLADAEAVAQGAGVRLDDVVLAACGAALRRWLLDRRALPKEPLVALVPLAPGDPAAQGVEAATPALLVGLATDVADPMQRLHAIAGASPANAGSGTRRAGVAAGDEGGAGTGGRSEAGGDGTGRAGAGASGSSKAEAAGATARGFSFVGASLLLQGALSGRGRPGRAEPAPLPANATICTMAGPRAPLHLAGARMVAVHPVSIPTHGLAVSIAAQCYGGDLDIGVTACRHVLPDAAQLAEHVLDGLAELKRAIAAARPASGDLASGAGAAAAGATADAAASRRAAPASSGEAPPPAAEATAAEAAGDRPGGDAAGTAAHADDTGPAGAPRQRAGARPAAASAAPAEATSTGDAAATRSAPGVRKDSTPPADAAPPAGVAGQAAANDAVATAEDAAGAEAAARKPAAGEAAAGEAARSDRAADGDAAAAPPQAGRAPGGKDVAAAPAVARDAAADDAGTATHEARDKPAPRARRGSPATGKAGAASAGPLRIAADDAGASMPARTAGASGTAGAARKSARGAKAEAGVPASAARRRAGAETAGSDTAGAAGTGDKAPAAASAAARDATKDIAAVPPGVGDTSDPAPSRPRARSAGKPTDAAAKRAAAKRGGGARTADAVVAGGDEPAAELPHRGAAPAAAKPGAGAAGDSASADAAASAQRRGGGAARKAGGEKASRSAGASAPRQAEAAAAGSKPPADGPAAAGPSGARKSARSAAGGRRSATAARPVPGTQPPDDAGDKELAPARARRTRD